MARVNINILGISELKWTRMGEFNSGDHYIYYRGQESLRRNGVAIMVNKRVWNAVLGCNLKNNRMISVRFQGKPFNITVIQVCAPTADAEEAEVLNRSVLWRPTKPSRTNTKKDVLFIIGELNAKVELWGLLHFFKGIIAHSSRHHGQQKGLKCSFRVQSQK